MMRSKISISLLIAGVALCVGCAASMKVHYYTIMPAPQPASAPANAAVSEGPVLLVGDIATPAMMQDDRIRYRIGSNESGAYEYHRWVDRPGAIVRNSLERALRASGRYQRVLDARSAAAGDYLLRGKLNEFGEVDDTSVHTRISLQVELVDMKTNRNVWDRLVEREEPVGAKNVADVVQSLDRNLRQVIGETASEIDRFLSTRR